MNPITNLARRLPSRRPAPLAAPTFTPVARHLATTRQQPAARLTGPIHVPAGRHTAPAPQTATGRPMADKALLNRVRGGLQKLPAHAPAQGAGVDVRQRFEADLRRHFDGLLLRTPGTDAETPPVPLTRAGRFTRDARKPAKGGLPVFRAVGRDIGWADLDSLGASPWPAADAARQSLALIGAQTDAARAGVWQGISDAARREAQIRAAADADAAEAADANLIMRRHEGVL